MKAIRLTQRHVLNPNWRFRSSSNGGVLPPPGRVRPRRDDRQACAGARGAHQTKGAAGVLEAAAAASPPALCETAFCFATRIAVADGSFDENEKRMLTGTANILSISKDAFNKIIDVVVVMQRTDTASSDEPGRASEVRRSRGNRPGL